MLVFLSSETCDFPPIPADNMLVPGSFTRAVALVPLSQHKLLAELCRWCLGTPCWSLDELVSELRPFRLPASDTSYDLPRPPSRFMHIAV